VQGDKPGETVVKFRGAEPLLTVGERRMPLLAYHDELRNVATKPIETGWVYKPMLKAKNIEGDRLTAQRIVYEGRAAKVLLDEKKLEEIENYYDKCFIEGANEYQIEESKKATARMDVILGNKDRLKLLAADFVTHYEARISEGASVFGKVMFVCSSRPIAYEFYKQVIALRPKWAESLLAADGVQLSDVEDKLLVSSPMIRMVMTRNQDDVSELYDLLGTKDDRKELDRQFKIAKSNFKIAIVVDMWLTGFDVPFLEAIYIDKPIQQHSLIQTISRVNRVYEGKEVGLVVDYIGIKSKMNTSLKKYSKVHPADFEDVEKAVAVLRDCLDLLHMLFHKFDDASATLNGFCKMHRFARVADP
jgi:type I restriction enzyme R subunit